MRAAARAAEKAANSTIVHLEKSRRILVYAFLAVGIWYLWWRLGTFNSHAKVLSGVIYAAELFGFITALMHIFMCWKQSERRAPPARAGITVDVFIPTYNESPSLVRKTVLAAQGMQYPHRTWLLDDGRRAEMKALAEELGCEYLTRNDNAHAKAGNLNNALAHSRGELVVVFDADHAPRRDFLVETIGYFDDPDVAFVQTPQDYYNLDSYQHRKSRGGTAVWTEQSLFFRVIQRGKDCWNAAFFCGSCAVVRRSALDRIGGFATGTVTEDLHTSIRLHAQGYKSVYHAQPLAFGLAPRSVEPFIVQRLRWGQGAMHVWRLEGILTNRNLTWAQRINYLASVLTYFDGWQKAVFYLAPVVALVTGTLPLVTSTSEFLLHFAPYYFLTFWMFEEVSRGYGRTLFIEQYSMARFAAFAAATLAWIFPRLKFKVTPKSSAKARAARFLAPQWAIMSLNLFAVPIGVGLFMRSQGLPLEGVIANTAWAAVNVALAAMVLVYSSRVQRRKRAEYRFPVPLPARIWLGGVEVRGTVDDISNTGLRFYGLLPPYIYQGCPFSGELSLPEGSVAFSGHIRTLEALPDSGGVIKAFGAQYTTSEEERKRLERFLFGSDVQWRVNGYCEQAATPLSRLLPRAVAGPAPKPFADRRWNAAELRLPGRRKAQILASVRGGATGETWILSFNPLPEGCGLILRSFRRRSQLREIVRLHRLPQHAQIGSGVFAYQTVLSDPKVIRALDPSHAATQDREVA
jgi:cellulose synthase (UDP-forming)